MTESHLLSLWYDSQRYFSDGPWHGLAAENTRCDCARSRNCHLQAKQYRSRNRRNLVTPLAFVCVRNAREPRQAPHLDFSRPLQIESNNNPRRFVGISAGDNAMQSARSTGLIKPSSSRPGDTPTNTAIGREGEGEGKGVASRLFRACDRIGRSSPYCQSGGRRGGAPASHTSGFAFAAPGF